MNLQLNRPLVFFDLETTGLQIAIDRIVEISLLKVHPNGKQDLKTWRVNPQIPIPKEASEVHGITNEMVVEAPTFKQIAPEVKQLMKDSDLAGFNSNRFDIPVLVEEFLRNDIDFDLDKVKTVDVQVIFHKKEPRNLTAAYQFYCDKNLENAHSAEADTIATFEILDAQVARYKDVEPTVAFLDKFTDQRNSADYAGFIRYDEEGDEIFSFGKYKSQKVKEVLDKDPGYFGWVQNADFPLYTKKVLTKIKLRQFNQ